MPSRRVNLLFVLGLNSLAWLSVWRSLLSASAGNTRNPLVFASCEVRGHHLKLSSKFTLRAMVIAMAHLFCL